MDQTEISLVRPLMIRFVYLNNLRVRVTLFFVTVVAAVFAVIRIWPDRTGPDHDSHRNAIESLTGLSPLALLPVLLIGGLVLVFDVRCRARASVVAQAIRKIVQDQPDLVMKKNLSRSEMLGEDFYFSLITIIINSLLISPLPFVLYNLNLVGLTVTLLFSALLIVLSAFIQIRFYIRRWPELAREWQADPWPDSNLLELSKDQDA